MRKTHTHTQFTPKANEVKPDLAVINEGVDSILARTLETGIRNHSFEQGLEKVRQNGGKMGDTSEKT